MPLSNSASSRRWFLKGLGATPAFFHVPGLFAEQLVLTPPQTEGPFYPDKLPLDTDNDLIVISNSITPAVGAIAHLSGRVLTSAGQPVRNALVEIWQCDANGAYLHSRTGNRDKRDVNFQGFGRFETASNGEYRFRTIKPVPYPGRTPHIHFLIKAPGRDRFVTQCYIKGHPANEKDGVLRGIRDQAQRDSVLIPFDPLPKSNIGEVAARFDIVLAPVQTA
jgi:protocatechuate 3,4-dioxygenase beta subunit